MGHVTYIILLGLPMEQTNLNTFYAPPKARILTRNPVKLTLEPLSHIIKTITRKDSVRYTNGMPKS